MSAYEFVPAGSIVVGDAVVEADGYLWAVMKIERVKSVLVFTLANDFSPMNSWRSTGAGVTMRKRASSKVATVRGGGSTVVPTLATR